MSKAEVVLPQLEVLLSIGGSHDQPAHDLTFQGLTFSHTSWLGPSSSDGYANQQTGAFIAGPKSQYPEFEATRPVWHQMPAAVQVSAAKNIAFVRDRFVALGQVGLGIGNDDNAHLSKVGLGADSINVVGCVFTQIAGGAIVVGGIQAKAHHPGGDVPLSALTAAEQRMIDQNITIENNLIYDVAIDYRDFAGVMYTYTQNVVVSHNEVYNLPYSGINSGYGWGVNDAGGNNEYKTRGNGESLQVPAALHQPDHRPGQPDRGELRAPRDVADERRRLPLQPVGVRDHRHAELLQRLGFRPVRIDLR